MKVAGAPAHSSRPLVTALSKLIGLKSHYMHKFTLYCRARKKVPSSRPGQADFLLGQVTFKFTCPMGKV